MKAAPNLKAIFFSTYTSKTIDCYSTAELMSVLQLLLTVKSSWAAEISSINILQIHPKKFQSEKNSAGVNSGGPMGIPGGKFGNS